MSSCNLVERWIMPLVTLHTDGSHALDAGRRITSSFNLVDIWNTFSCNLNTDVSCSHVTLQTDGSQAVSADMGNMFFCRRMGYGAHIPGSSRQMFHALL